MKLEGVVKQVFPKQVISDKFSKIEFLVTYGDRYPKDVLVTASGKSLQYAEQLGEGQEVEIEFDLQSRPTKDGKYFGASVNAWQIHVIGNQDTGDATSYSQVPTEGDKDQLPF